MGVVRNPKAHGGPSIADLQFAIEELMTARLLLRLVGYYGWWYRSRSEALVDAALLAQWATGGVRLISLARGAPPSPDCSVTFTLRRVNRAPRATPTNHVA